MKNIIIGIIIGGIIFTLGGVVATTAISSTNVTYQNKTVNSALDELYNEATTGKELVAAAITNKGVTTTSSDTYETMANNINNIDTNNSELNQKINNLESKHNSDIASLTGSISNLNQSLTNLKSEWKFLDKINTNVPCKIQVEYDELYFVFSDVDGGSGWNAVLLIPKLCIKMLEKKYFTGLFFYNPGAYTVINILFEDETTIKSITWNTTSSSVDYKKCVAYLYYK